MGEEWLAYINKLGGKGDHKFDDFEDHLEENELT
jgi:predicted esterase YcpF (UPF0227 family)